MNPARLARVGRLINWVVRVRGWKAVGTRSLHSVWTVLIARAVPYFPSSIPYLPMLVTLLSPPATSPPSVSTTLHHPIVASQEAWELRTVLLLWLALLLTVPFDLSALSSTTSTTAFHIDRPAREKLFIIPSSDLASRITVLALPFLHRQGKEGAYVGLALARLFSRPDAVPSLPGFLDWAGTEIVESEREGEANLVASFLEFMAAIATMIAPDHLDVLRRFLDEMLLPHLRGSRTAASSALVRKLAIKAQGRWWVARMGKGFRDVVDGEMMEGLEEQLDDLMSGLGDKVGFPRDRTRDCA